MPGPSTRRAPSSRYVLGYCGHDGTTAITLKNVATRVVCQNTLGVALGEKCGSSRAGPR
nr:DUF932 domain-containing protein [Stigmatella aurantiaca]